MNVFRMLAWWCVGLSLIVFGVNYARRGTLIEISMWKMNLGVFGFIAIATIFTFIARRHHEHNRPNQNQDESYRA